MSPLQVPPLPVLSAKQMTDDAQVRAIDPPSRAFHAVELSRRDRALVDVEVETLPRTRRAQSRVESHETTSTFRGPVGIRSGRIELTMSKFNRWGRIFSPLKLKHTSW